MTFRTLLAAATMLHAVPALAAIDPPAASTLDHRMRVLAYNRNNPVQLYVAPGMSLRLQLGAGEEVEQVVASDQGTIAPDEEAPAPSGASTVSSTVGPPSGGQKWPPSCDLNLCRTVVGNFVYLKALRSLDPQPLFIQTKWCSPETAKCEMVPYAFELLTKPGDPKVTAAASAWDVTFTYPDRERAARLAAQRKAQAERAAAWRERQALRPPPPAAPVLTANWRYGYRGWDSVMPDEAWDDGRTTFLRFNGNRRVPNVYRRLPDKKEAIPAYATEPDAEGTTLRIARTEAKWFVRDGDAVGCLFNIGPDPDGKTASTVATLTSTISAGARP